MDNRSINSLYQPISIDSLNHALNMGEIVNVNNNTQTFISTKNTVLGAIWRWLTGEETQRIKNICQAYVTILNNLDKGKDKFEDLENIGIGRMCELPESINDLMRDLPWTDQYRINQSIKHSFDAAERRSKGLPEQRYQLYSTETYSHPNYAGQKYSKSLKQAKVTSVSNQKSNKKQSNQLNLDKQRDDKIQIKQQAKENKRDIKKIDSSQLLNITSLSNALHTASYTKEIVFVDNAAGTLKTIKNTRFGAIWRRLTGQETQRIKNICQAYINIIKNAGKENTAEAYTNLFDMDGPGRGISQSINKLILKIGGATEKKIRASITSSFVDLLRNYKVTNPNKVTSVPTQSPNTQPEQKKHTSPIKQTDVKPHITQQAVKIELQVNKENVILTNLQKAKSNIEALDVGTSTKIDTTLKQTELTHVQKKTDDLMNELKSK